MISCTQTNAVKRYTLNAKLYTVVVKTCAQTDVDIKCTQTVVAIRYTQSDLSKAIHILMMS